jgi:hypothetical protein
MKRISGFFGEPAWIFADLSPAQVHRPNRSGCELVIEPGWGSGLDSCSEGI